jgi:hypothetical protein
MIRPAYEDSTASRLARASEELSILGHELTAATAELHRELSLQPKPTGRGSGVEAVASTLDSTSDRLRMQALAIAEIVYAIAEDEIAASGDPRAERCAAALGRVARVVEPIFEIAEELAGRLLASYRLARALNRRLESADLRALDVPIQELLGEHEAIATGAGVAMSPGLLRDKRYWMQWWLRDRGGCTQLHLQLDPDQPDFYDYESSAWYVDPAGELVPHLAPPHFDAGGVNDYMITATVPTMDADGMIGLGCAEMTLSRLGALVSPALQALGAPATLVTPDLLVAATTAPGLSPGHPMAGPLAALSSEDLDAAFTKIRPGITVTRSAALAWWLIVDWTASADGSSAQFLWAITGPAG